MPASLPGRIRLNTGVSVETSVRMCTDSCHYVLSNPGDPTYAPSYKADQIRKFFKRHYDWTGRVAPCRVKAEAHGVSFRVDAAPDTGTFSVDARAVRSMLTNLIDNAVDACRIVQGADSHEVKILLSGDADNIVIEIADNGMGMSREVREKALTLFFSSKGTGGTGLSLFIADKIARSHGGAIEIESEAGEGLRFIITMPRNPKLPPDRDEPASAKRADSRGVEK